MIRNAYVEFSKDIEKNNKYEESSFVMIQKLFLSVAYADDSKCFFGGWPSQMNGEVCKSPMTHGNTTWASNVQCKMNKNAAPKSCNQIIDFTYNSCGDSGKFRCNPILFGADQKGKGKCINTNGTYRKLTQKCVDQTKGTKELRDSEQFLKDNPALLDEYRKNVQQFCMETYRPGEDYDHNYTCDALKERLDGIVDDVEEEKEELVEAQKVTAAKVNKALGILDKCQKDYNASKDGIFSEFFASRRDSLDQMVAYGKCSNEDIDTSISSQQLEELVAGFDNVSNKILPKEILDDSVNDGVELTLKNLLFTMDQFGENINIDALLWRYPRLKASPYKENVEKSLADFKRAKDKGALEKTKINKNDIVKNLNEFSNKINSLCQNINTEYTRRTKSKDKSISIDEGTFTNTDSEQAYYDETQVKMTEMYKEFLESDELNISRIMATDHFKSDIFPFSNGISERCAEGKIDNIAFTPVGIEDIDEAMEDYKDLMLDELGDFNKMAKVRDDDDIQDSIQDLIKYRPYLLGNFLKKSYGNPELQDVYATYLCKESMDVYSSDEMWRIGEVAAGGAGLVVSGALVATGIGSPLGVGLAAASSTLIAAEGAMAINNYMDASKASDASSSSFATESISVEQHTKNIDSADSKKTDALIAGGTALVQPLAFLTRPGKIAGKSLSVVKESGKKSSKIADSVDTPLRLVDKSSDVSSSTRLLPKPKTSSVKEPSTSVSTYKPKTKGTSVSAKSNSSRRKRARPSRNTSSKTYSKDNTNTGSYHRKKARSKAKERAKAKEEAELKAKADAKAEADLKAKAEADLKAKAQAKAEADLKAKAKAKAEADAKARANAKKSAEKKASSSTSGEVFKTKSEVTDYILKNHSIVKKLPTDAAKGYTFKTIAGVRNVLKNITGKDYKDVPAKEIRKEIKRLSTIFHPDKIQGKNDFFKSTVKDEMSIINAMKSAL